MHMKYIKLEIMIDASIFNYAYLCLVLSLYKYIYLISFYFHTVNEITFLIDSGRK